MRTTRTALAAATVLAVALGVGGGALAAGLDDDPARPSTLAAAPTDGDGHGERRSSATGPLPTTTSTTAGPTVTLPEVALDDLAANPAATGSSRQEPSAGAPGPSSPPPAPTPSPEQPAAPGAWPEPTGPEEPLDDDGPIPGPLEEAVPTDHASGGEGLGGADDLASAPSCATQCITKGVAIPTRTGATILVETNVPAEYFISAVADLDGDGSYETYYHELTPAGTSSHTWVLTGLEPGTTYYVMAAATDAHADTSYVWGQFTTQP